MKTMLLKSACISIQLESYYLEKKHYFYSYFCFSCHRRRCSCQSSIYVHVKEKKCSFYKKN